MTDHKSPAPEQTSDQPLEQSVRRRRWRIVITVIFVAGVIGGFLIVTSRSDEEDSTVAATTTTATVDEPDDSAVASDDDDDDLTLSWTKVNDELEEAIFLTPVDHANPDGEMLNLRILRRPADDEANRIGTLLVNPGGPGFGAETLVAGAEDIYQPEILSRFDIVGMDPRGTGGSTPAIDCIDDLDEIIAVADISPQDDAAKAKELELTKSFVQDCVDRTGNAIAHMSTESTARDLDRLRRALGEEKISYFGFSYGCTLGATWATLFPDTVRAAVLDGCADPTASESESARQQAAGFQRSVEAFLDKCESAGAECPIGQNRQPVEDLRELWALAATGDLPGAPGRPAVNEWTLQTAIIVSMYSEDFWPVLAQAIANGLLGDGSTLTQLADAYYQRREDGTWGNELEATLVINCMDEDQPMNDQEAAALDEELTSIAPLLYPEGFSSTPFCKALPVPADSVVTITGSGAPTILVVGNTGDPATPFASTQKMASALQSSVLVAVETNNHGGYGLNDCINETVHRYLIDLVAPDEGVRC